MTKLTLLGAAAILATALATPAMSQEATQEPGMIGFNYPNSNYLRGGYGVRTPSRYDHSYYHGGYGLALGFVLEGFRISLRSSGLRVNKKAAARPL